MRRGIAVRAAAGVAAVLGATLAFADSGGPDPGHTGGPLEGLCSDCHSEDPINSGGSISLVDAPPLYRAGSTYIITVRLQSSQTATDGGRRWGFQLTAIRESNGAGAGTFANVSGQGTQILSGSGPLSTRRYIEHTDPGTHTGAASPVEWKIQWTAPNPGVGPVRFYAAGLAANGNGNESGDWVYSFNSALGDSATPTLPATWGRIKADRR